MYNIEATVYNKVKNPVTSSGITKNFKSLTSTITKKEDTIFVVGDFVNDKIFAISDSCCRSYFNIKC